MRSETFNKGSPIYCMEPIQRYGWMLVGEINGFVDVVDINEC